MLHAVLNRMKCEAEQRAEERAREAVARKLTMGKSGVASKLRKRSRAGYLTLAVRNLKR